MTTNAKNTFAIKYLVNTLPKNDLAKALEAYSDYVVNFHKTHNAWQHPTDFIEFYKDMEYQEG